MKTDALLLLPALAAGNLTSMEGTTTVPWEPNGGFELHALGLRLRRKQPVVEWLAQFGLQLDVDKIDDNGTWFRLTSKED